MEEVPILHYSTAGCEKRLRIAALLPRIFILLSIAFSAYAFVTVVAMAHLWAREAGSGCGLGRGTVRAALGSSVVVLIVSTAAHLAGRRFTPRAACISKLGLLAAATAWATLWIWFGCQRDFRLWL